MVWKKQRDLSLGQKGLLGDLWSPLRSAFFCVNTWADSAPPKAATCPLKILAVLSVWTLWPTELGANVPFRMYFEVPCLMLHRESLGPGQVAWAREGLGIYAV